MVISDDDYRHYHHHYQGAWSRFPLDLQPLCVGRILRRLSDPWRLQSWTGSTNIIFLTFPQYIFDHLPKSLNSKSQKSKGRVIQND